MIPKVDFKGIRARVIEGYMARAGYISAVCFSCGNAARALQGLGVPLAEIGPRGDLQTKRWWLPEEIRDLWPTKFDATPGHLPLFLMLRIAMCIRDTLGTVAGSDYPGVGLAVPTGSGESIMCMHLAYPAYRFIAVYDDNSPSTTYFCGAPLSNVVARMFTPVYIRGGDINEYKIRWPDATAKEAADG